MAEMIIDAKDLIAGRLCSFAAKKALLGETISILNSEGAVITGNRRDVLGKFKHRLQRGMPKTGPFVHRPEHRFLKRMIRGMLPYKNFKGKTAFKRIKCYMGVPKEFEGKKFITINEANVAKTQSLKYITLKELCHQLGRKP